MSIKLQKNNLKSFVLYQLFQPVSNVDIVVVIEIANIAFFTIQLVDSEERNARQLCTQ